MMIQNQTSIPINDYSLAPYFFQIKMTPIRIKGGENNMHSYIIDQNIVANEPAQLSKKNSK